MAALGRWSPLHRPFVWGFASLLMLAAMFGYFGGASLFGSYLNGSTALNLSIPPRPGSSVETSTATFTPAPDAPAVEGGPVNPAFTEPALDPLKPSEPDLNLVDASPFGPLPRIGDDGRQPLSTYARPYDPADDRPKIAIMVTGLGQQADATNASFHLPGAISLMFSPYAEDLPSYFGRARLAGHEVLIELPMEPADYPASDPGPHTLRASGTVDANIERLNWVLGRSPGYFAVAGDAGVFADSAEATPVMAALASRGLGMIEIDGDKLADTVEESGLAYSSTSNWIDSTPSPVAIGQSLDKLEAEAKQSGSALGIAQAYPVTLRHLADWAATLEERGIALVPVSALILDANGSSTNDSQAPNLAQSRS